MADTERKFSELVNAGVLTGAEIVAMSQVNVGSLLSVKETLQAIANWFAINSQYASALDTTSKTVCGAINELKQLISVIPQFSIEVVQTLPTEDISETTIYMTPSQNPQTQDAYDEFIYVNNAWEHVGSTAVDLSAYYTKLEVDGLLAVKANTADVTAALSTKENTADLDEDVTDIIVDLTDPQTTATGNPVTFTTSQAGGAKSALVTFAPKQSGTGDPSPSNIRPISGWDGLNLTIAGKNLFDINNVYYTVTGTSFTTPSGGYSKDIYTNTNGETTAVGSSYLSKLPFLKAGTYTLSYSAGSQLRVGLVADDGTVTTLSTVVSGQQFTLTSDSKITLRRVTNAERTYTDLQIEAGSIKTDYEAYITPTTYTATFPSTIMGGSYDFATGEGSEIWYYIAIYAGETLPGEWMSDRDVYEPNTTPTTGAEVAYIAAAPTEITLTPADANLLKGSNTVWTDGDTVQVEYSELPQGNLGAVIDYIQKLEARVKALES